jgi:hypothetical protein
MKDLNESFTGAFRDVFCIKLKSNWTRRLSRPKQRSDFNAIFISIYRSVSTNVFELTYNI